MANGTWRIARGKGSAQLPLAVVAVLAIVVLLAGKAHFLPFDRARASITDWAAPAIQAINVPAAAISRWFGGIGHFFDVYSENLRLREENARLRQWQSAALTLEMRMKHYRLLLNAVPDPSLSSVTARVIGRSSRPFLETVILGAGRRSGIRPGQAVIDARGMLGRIYLVGDHTSWVILLADLNSRIPVSIQPGNVQAILAGDNSRAPNVEALAQGAKLKSGQEVVTSGDGGLLPPGLPVGILASDRNGFRVVLFADPKSASEVRIVDFKTPVERLPPATDRDLPASAAGYRPSPPNAHAVSSPSTAAAPAPAEVHPNQERPVDQPAAPSGSAAEDRAEHSEEGPQGPDQAASPDDR